MRLFKGRWLPAAAALLLSAAISACGGDPLERQVEESNRHLPQDMGYGMTLDRLAYADSTVSAYVNVAESEVQLSAIRAHSDLLRDDFARFMREQPDTTDVGATVSLIKEKGASLQMLFCTEADTVAITVPSAEL